MRTDGRYDEDEVLIFGGRVADEVMRRLKLITGFTDDEHDAIRNHAADAAEAEMEAWCGPTPPLTLPVQLVKLMTEAARDSAIQHWANLAHVNGDALTALLGREKYS